MTWKTWIDNEKNKPYFKKLESFLNNALEKEVIYPEKSLWFNAFNLTPVDRIKVVLIGQDPYHGKGQAHGLCFSTLNEKLPPSLKNIYKELSSDLDLKVPKSGNLTKWANEGVLLLNTILTVQSGKPLSHKNKGWEIFTTQMIKHISNLDQPIVFILWGSQARQYKEYVHNKKHLVLESVHPSPLSAYNGFFGSKPFSKTNNFLQAQNVNPIDWDLS